MLGKICRSWQRTLQLAYIIGLPPYCDDGDHHHPRHHPHHDNRDVHGDHDVRGDYDTHDDRGVGGASIPASISNTNYTRQYSKPKSETIFKY